MSLEVVSIIIGVVGAILGVYFREAFRRANEQKKVAIKLDAFLYDMQREVLLMDDLKPIIDLAIQNIQPLDKLVDKYKDAACDEILRTLRMNIKVMDAMVEAKDEKLLSGLKKQYIEIRNMPEAYYKAQIKWYEEIISDLRDEKSITTDEVATLSSYLTQLYVIYKSEAAMAGRELLFHNVLLRSSGNFDVDQLSKSISSMVSGIINSAILMFVMRAELNKFIHKKTFILFLENIFY